jgi:hypothetical protein
MFSPAFRQAFVGVSPISIRASTAQTNPSTSLVEARGFRVFCGVTQLYYKKSWIIASDGEKKMQFMATTTAESLLQLRTKLRLSQPELAKALSGHATDKPVPLTRYQGWEYGRSKIPDWVDSAILKIQAELAGVDPSLTVQGLPMVKLTVRESVAAGEGEFSVDFNEEDVWVPAHMTYEGCRGAVVREDSMMPQLQPGDITIYDERRIHPTAGMSFMLLSKNGRQVKKLRWKAGVWHGHSINPTVDDFPLLDNQICGMLTGVYGKRNGAYYCLSQREGLYLPEVDE